MRILGKDNGRHVVETEDGVVHLTDEQLEALRTKSADAPAEETKSKPDTKGKDK